MNYEKILLEMLERIKNLEERVEKLEGTSGDSAREKGENFSQVCRDYIAEKKRSAKAFGQHELVLLCNDIQKEFGVTNRAPTICAAMYGLMNEGDEVLFAPPSGKSTTVKIKYYL